MENPRHKSSQAGFTMVELIMVIMIVGTLAWIGTSSFRYVSASNRISTEINALLSDMRFARTEAIKEGLFVTVCASANSTTCSSSSPWQNGWIVISDPNGTQTANGAPLRVQPALSLSYNASTDVFVVNNSFWAVTFNRQGFGTNVASPTNIATLALHTAPVENAQWTRCLAITAIGLLTIQQNGSGSCT
jgi:type IV fimbrial biogenesis protein FimT